jgi:trigger factor
MEKNQEFSGEGIVLHVEHNDHCRVVFNITVSAEKTIKIYSKALKGVSKEVSIPGFRKGKAPVKLIEEGFKPAVDKEWKDLLLNDCFNESMKLSKTFLFRQDSIKKASVKKCSKEDGAEIHIEFESFPHIPEFDYSTIEVEDCIPKEIAEEDISKRMKEQQKELGRWSEITERPVQDGDTVVISIDYLEEKGEKNAYKDYPVTVDKEKIGSWLYDSLLGAKPGEAIEKLSELDNNASDEIKETFTPTKCRISVSKAYVHEAHEVNEELFKAFHCASIEDLNAKNRQALEQDAIFAAKKCLRDTVLKAIMEGVKFDLPASEVEKERQERIKNRIQELNKQGLPKEEVLKMKEQIEKEVAENIDSDLRIVYIYGSIVEKEKLQVTKEEVDEKLPQYKDAFMYLYKDADPKNLEVRVQNDLIIEKIWDYLFKTVKIIKKD